MVCAGGHGSCSGESALPRGPRLVLHSHQPSGRGQEGGEGEAALGEVWRLRSWRGEAAPLASAPAHSRRRQLAQKQSAASSSRHRSSSRASWVRT